MHISRLVWICLCGPVTGADVFSVTEDYGGGFTKGDDLIDPGLEHNVYLASMKYIMDFRMGVGRDGLTMAQWNSSCIL